MESAGMKDKRENCTQGEWLLIRGNNFMSFQSQYYCNVCGHVVSIGYPNNVCEHCGSINKYNGNSISVSMEIVDK